MSFPKSSDDYLKNLAKRVAQKSDGESNSEFPPVPDDVSDDEHDDEHSDAHAKSTPSANAEGVKEDVKEATTAPSDALPVLDNAQIESALDESTFSFAYKTLKSIHTYYITLAVIYIVTKIVSYLLPYILRALAWLGRALAWLLVKLVSTADKLCILALCALATGTGWLVILALVYGPLKGRAWVLSLVGGLAFALVLSRNAYSRLATLAVTALLTSRAYSKASKSKKARR